METRENKRVVGIIQKDNKILLIRRIKNEGGYYVFPGGAGENNESEEKALKREMEEETSLIIGESKKLFEMKNQGRREIYYLIKEFTGVPRIQGPEKKRMGIDNQYILEWRKISEIKKMKDLYPQKAAKKFCG